MREESFFLLEVADPVLEECDSVLEEAARGREAFATRTRNLPTPVSSLPCART